MILDLISIQILFDVRVSVLLRRALQPLIRPHAINVLHGQVLHDPPILGHQMLVLLDPIESVDEAGLIVL